MPRIVNRGFVPADAKEFADEVLPVLRYAQQDIVYLLNRGYDLAHAVTFVGNRFQFSARQRAALTRATAADEATAERKRRQLAESLQGGVVYIDGFNLVITLEAAQSPQTTLMRCMDGTVRDLCGLHGTYRLIDATAAALRWVGEFFAQQGVARAVFYLDAPVSNLGRLGAAIMEEIQRCCVPCEVLLVPNADAALWGRASVVTSDAIILDRCESWVNLAAQLIALHLPERRIVGLDCSGVE